MSRDLHKLLGEGGLGQLVQPWEPWWKLPEAASVQLSSSGERLVQPSGGPLAGVPCCIAVPGVLSGTRVQTRAAGTGLSACSVQ